MKTGMFSYTRPIAVTCLTLLYLWLDCLPAGAEAWPQKQNEIFLAPKIEYYETGEYWDRSGDRHSMKEEFKKLSAQTYMEYGLTKKDTLTAKAFYDFVDNEDGSTQGFSDVELGYRRCLFNQSGMALSAGITGLIPAGYSINEMPSLGYDRLGMETFLAAGYGWEVTGRNGFAETTVRFRTYEGFPSDQLRGSLVLGQDITRILQLILESEIQWGLDNGDTVQLDDDTTIDAYYRLFKMTLHCRIRMTDDQSLVFSGFRNVWGENTGAGGGLALAYWITF
ncbi:MAG: hypothetical protein M0O96_04225 [Desulforhopalus sp.]|nr:hypothetical protein [Desulforhopalus sp.]